MEVEAEDTLLAFWDLGILVDAGGVVVLQRCCRVVGSGGVRYL